jgi:hypothetical protein
MLAILGISLAVVAAMFAVSFGGAAVANAVMARRGRKQLQT